MLVVAIVEDVIATFLQKTIDDPAGWSPATSST